MSGYVEIIIQALVAFPLAAALITMPFLIHHYRKFGSITFLRIFLVYSFVLYLLCAYFLVILPLPDREVVAQLTTPAAQLIPFSFFWEFPKETNFRLTDFSTYFPAFASGFTMQFLFNIALLFPLGFYLRYYFRRGLFRTALTSLGVSLFFELTQLSGLYGIYPRPYRLFDIDDLICNTLGGCLGYLFTGILLRILPDREEIDEKSYEKGERITFPRRFLAFCVDMPFVLLLWIPVSLAFSALSLDGFSFSTAYLLYFGLLQWLWKGKSLGKRLMKFRLVDEDGSPITWWRAVLRYSLICVGVFSVGQVTDLLLSSNFMSGTVGGIFCLFLLAGLYLLLLFFFFLETLLNRSHEGRDYFHGKLSGTRLESSVERQSVAN